LFTARSSFFPSLNLGSLLAKGVDGSVYDIVGNPEWVIKVCSPPEESRLGIILDYLLFYRPNHCASIIGYQKLDGMIAIVMERLLPIDTDEVKVLTTLISHEDANKSKSLDDQRIIPLIDGLSKGMSFSQEKMLAFIRAIVSSPLQHGDLHPRNVMKDAAGNFKLIDFDRSTIKEHL
jgi:hypothetical protein